MLRNLRFLFLLLFGFPVAGHAADGLGLRVLTYNIHHGEGTDGRLDIQRVARVLLDLAPDVVALQEVDRKTARIDGEDHLEQLASVTGWQAAFGEAMPFQGGHYGNAILSRFPLTELETHALPFRQGQEPRCALVATVTPDNGLPPFRVVSTHLSHDVEEVRIEQASEIAALLERKADLPVILAGDFNARPRSATMQVFQSNRWVDQVAPKSVIDYVLTREADPWERRELFISEDRVTSDHRPVLVDLVWKGKRQPRMNAGGFPGALVVLGDGIDPDEPELGRQLRELLKDTGVRRRFPGEITLAELERSRTLLEQGGSVVGSTGLLRLLTGVDFSVNDDGVLVVQGRRARGMGGGGSVTGGDSREIVLSADKPVDLTALRRAAVEGNRDPFPSDPAATPEVPKGTLVLVGGARVPKDVLDSFFAAAGETDARIGIIPISSPHPVKGTHWMEREARSRGVEEVVVLEGRTPGEVDAPESLAFLQRATGIWFGGGRQWRFVDAYENTEAAGALHGVLQRGGVIGGTSAGASIQGEYMARGNPLGSKEIMADGYERGLGYLPGVAVDQHFTERNRFADLASLVDTYPQLLGVGIDESTALIVRGGVGKVAGKGGVHFYDRRQPVPEGGPDHETVSAGGAYDLVKRAVVRRPE